MSLHQTKNRDSLVCVRTNRPKDTKLRALLDSESRNYKRVQERQLQRQLDEDINGSITLDGTTDTRYNPAYDHEDWALGNQLEHGARLTPHRP